MLSKECRACVLEVNGVNLFSKLEYLYGAVNGHHCANTLKGVLHEGGHVEVLGQDAADYHRGDGACGGGGGIVCELCAKLYRYKNGSFSSKCNAQCHALEMVAKCWEKL